MKISMKKLISISLYFVLGMLILNVSQVSLAAEESGVYIIIKGNLLEMEEEPIIRDGRIYVPVRYFAEALDFKVEWIEEQKTAKFTNTGATILIPIGMKELFFNGQKVMLDEMSFIEKGRIYMPLRAVAEVLSQKVEWDQDNKTAIVSEFASKEYAEGPIGNYYLYVNEKYGFNMKIPKETKDKLVIKELSDRIEFFDKYNYDIEKNTGAIFTIMKTANPRILYIVPGYALKYDKGDYYIAYFASDVQYIVGDKKSTDSYMEMVKLSKEFLPSFYLKKTKD